MTLRRKGVVFTLRIMAFFLVSLALVHILSAMISLIINSYTTWQYILIYIQLVVEAIVFFQSFFMINGMASSLFKEVEPLNKITPKEYPTLDVFVPVREVNVSILRETIKALVDQDYPKDKLQIFIADDTTDKNLASQYSELADEFSVNYIYDPSNNKYKSGMLNIALPQGTGKRVAFFDYDQVPTEGILKHMVEILEAYPDRAFVQTKKKFRDLYNLSRVWSALLYVQFFEVMEKTKMELDTVLFAGSTACFRRSVLEEVGGIPEKTFTEDNELTTILLINNHFGLFSDVYGSVGTVPDGFNAQVSQLWRWSHGGSHVLHEHGVDILKTDNLSWSQKIDMLSILAVTPSIVVVYIYILSFIPLLAAGVDSPRYELFGVSTLFFIPIAPALTYLTMVTIGMWKIQQHSSEYSMKQLPGFLVIALASNILILGSGVLGFLGLWGPSSRHGKWTRKVPIRGIAILAFLLSISLIIISLKWLLAGFGSAIILLMIGLSLLPTLPVVLYYDR